MIYSNSNGRRNRSTSSNGASGQEQQRVVDDLVCNERYLLVIFPTNVSVSLVGRGQQSSLVPNLPRETTAIKTISAFSSLSVVVFKSNHLTLLDETVCNRTFSALKTGSSITSLYVCYRPGEQSSHGLTVFHFHRFNYVYVFEASYNMATKNERVYKAFKEDNDLPVHHDVPFRPKGGYQYFFEWNTADDKENWRADGYRWKQNGKATYNYLDVEFIKIYFKILVGPDKYATSFARTAFINTSVPNRVFVWYEGDDTVAIDLPHGNAKHSSKRNTAYQRTKPSVLAQLKSSEKRPSEVYNDILASTTPEVAHQGVCVPRDVKQVQNARRRLQSSRTGDRTRPSSTTNTEVP